MRRRPLPPAQRKILAEANRLLSPSESAEELNKQEFRSPGQAVCVCVSVRERPGQMCVCEREGERETRPNVCVRERERERDQA